MRHNQMRLSPAFDKFLFAVATVLVSVPPSCSCLLCAPAIAPRPAPRHPHARLHRRHCARVLCAVCSLCNMRARHIVFLDNCNIITAVSLTCLLGGAGVHRPASAMADAGGNGTGEGGPPEPADGVGRRGDLSLIVVENLPWQPNLESGEVHRLRLITIN